MIKILICNNGLAAVKFIRSVRLVYPNMIFIGMVSVDDMDANAHFIKMLDIIESVPGGSNVNNYANVDLIVDIARKHTCQYVWPGWGHASENPVLPETLAKHGITFIGPHGHSMRALGDKINSTILAQTIGVPTIPWNGSELRGTEITDELVSQACVKDLETCQYYVRKIGTPVMLKASEGGGGKGIRLINDLSECEDAYAHVQREVPGSPIFVTKTITHARHIEVQLVGDIYGNCTSLSGRDCSMQRRHQKVIEEGPPTIVPDEIFKQMQQDAVKLGQAVQYVNLGTVEYLYCPDTREYYFLELNPRLQVEHTVTELITGLNLPALQVDIAMGMNLKNLEFSVDKYVVACRITAENQHFKPTTGTIDHIHFDTYSDTFGYFSVYNGKIHSFSDSQFGHVFVTCDNREKCIERMKRVLDTIHVEGTISSSVQNLRWIVDSGPYKDNMYNTKWLDGQIEKRVHPRPSYEQIAYISAIRTYNQYNQEMDSFINDLKRGAEPTLLPNIAFEMKCIINGEHKVQLNTRMVDRDTVRVHDKIDIRFEPNKNFFYTNTQKGIEYHVNGDNIYVGNQVFQVIDFVDDSQVISETVGLIHKIKFSEGDRVNKGDVLMEVEAMKMLMPICSKTSGTFAKAAFNQGDLFSKGDLLCTVDDDDDVVTDEPDNIINDLLISDALIDHSSQTPFITPDMTFMLYHTLYQDFFKRYPQRVHEWVLWMHQNPDLLPKEIRRNVHVNDVFQKLIFTFTTVQTDERPNDTGVRVWDCVFDGIPVMVVGNDKDVFAGSMSYRESQVYYDALHEARERKIPFVYLSGTAGARIGMNKELLKDIQVSKDGSSYLYVTDIEKYKYFTEYTKLSENEYRIDAIVNDGIGVDNLAGSALIAGEMARAYKEIPTITYVFNHSTGIGVYLARLSGRVIQHQDTAILLTGANALNELLGKKAYKSNLQLGGASDIMDVNGISQVSVPDDDHGVQQIYQYITKTFDKIHNHALLETAQEYMKDYAKTVHVYRGTIKGKPYGLIEPSSSLVREVTRIDHADDQSDEKVTQKPNNVLFPDTSYKISQFMHECNVEKLPLVIIANWRGFSGGTKDMFESVLKYGSMIVEQMAHYEHDIVVYVPPGGQLRGGSWVVFDPSLNKERIKMYCAPDSTGSILEPNGLCNVKGGKMFPSTSLSNNKSAQLMYATLHNTPKSFMNVIDDIHTYESLKENIF